MPIRSCEVACCPRCKSTNVWDINHNTNSPVKCHICKHKISRLEWDNIIERVVLALATLTELPYNDKSQLQHDSFMSKTASDIERAGGKILVTRDPTPRANELFQGIALDASNVMRICPGPRATYGGVEDSMREVEFQEWMMKEVANNLDIAPTAWIIDGHEGNTKHYFQTWQRNVLTKHNSALKN